MNLDLVLGLPKSGVVILTKDNTVLISYTTSMGAHLEEMYNLFKGQKDISIKVVSSGVDIETLKLHTEYYRHLYHNRLGFNPILNYQRKVIRYRVRIVPSHDFKRIDVEIVTARGDGKLVGRFKNIKEANVFIETYYGDHNAFSFPVYALNCDTKQFLLDDQKKLLDIK